MRAPLPFVIFMTSAIRSASSVAMTYFAPCASSACLLSLLRVAAMGVAPADCVYVGDDERDIIAARAAGMRSVVALWGYRLDEDDPQAWQGDVLVASPRDLLDATAWPE